MIDTIRKILNKLQVDIKRYPTIDLRRRKKLLEYYEITKILDVGANIGQYATEVRNLGFKGEIISFEPVKDVYQLLCQKAKKDRRWNCFNYALGDEEKEMSINISKNTFSSSILDILPSHVNNAPQSKTTHKETIIIKKLDSIYKTLIKEEEKVLLKIDVQGFEKQVLQGAQKSLSNIKGVQVEMSIEELYKDELLFMKMIELLESQGFKLNSLENGFFNQNSGKLLQVDGIFFRE